MKAHLKLVMTVLVATAVALAIIGEQACQLGKSDSYNTLSDADLTSLIDTMPDAQKRILAQNQTQRKGFITQFKQMFALAQAAQAEGLEKSEEFKQRMTMQTDQTLVNESMKRNPDAKYTEDEGKAYLAGHLKDFDADLKTITEGRNVTLAPEQVEMMKGQWGEMKVRAEKARQTGVDKDPAVLIQLKFGRANVLANLYSAHLEKKLKPSPEEVKKYLEEHPEADLEKIKQKAEGLLTRVKKGEDFASIAKQFTEDGSREQGGDLGWFGKGKMDAEFEKVAFALQKGQTSDLIKTKFGYHIIKLDDRRMTTPTPEPKPAAQTKATPAQPTPAPPEKVPGPTGPQEEIKARHIYLSTQEADGVEQMLTQKKVKRAMEDATLQYPVKTPEDFAVNVGGLRKDGPIPNTGSGRIIPSNPATSPTPPK